jgi:uncharacterized cupredoxin-like copper-binding protein
MTRVRKRTAAWGVLAVLAAGALASSAGAAAPPPTAVDWAKARRVDVVMTEYRFIPDHLTFQRGVPYRLHLENHGKELHEMTAPDFFKAVMLRDPGVRSPASGDVDVRPSQQKDVYFVAERAGRYELSCADHDWAGMTGEIVVP